VRWAALAASLAAAFGLWQARQIVAAPFPARYDYDEGVYAETAAAADRGARLYADVFLSQPPALILALRAAYRVAGESLPTARAVPVLASTVWLGALFAILAAAGRPRAGVLAACAAAGSAAFATAAHTVQMEAPSEALAAVSVAFAVIASTGRAGAWLLAGVALGLAVMTKLTALIALVPLAGIAAQPTRARIGPAPRPARWQASAALALGAAGAVLPFLPAIGAPQFIEDTVRYHVAAGRAAGAAPGAHLAAVSGFLAASWPVSAGAALGAWLACAASPARPERGSSPTGWRPWIALAWLAAEGTALVAVAPLWPHHLILLLTPLALLAGMGADAAIEAARAQRFAAPAALFCLVAYLAAAFPGARSDGSEALRRAAETLARDVPGGGSVLTDDPIVPFVAGRRIPPGLIDTSEVRIKMHALPEASLSGALSRPDVEAVLLWRGTFAASFPRLIGLARAEFPVTALVDGDRRLLLRRPPNAAGRRRAGAGPAR